MQELEQKFEQALVELCKQQKEICGWNPTRFLQTIQKYGGVKATKGWLAKGQPSECFDDLVEKNRLDLTLEALVVKSKYAALFTDDEVNECFAMLCPFGYYG